MSNHKRVSNGRLSALPRAALPLALAASLMAWHGAAAAAAAGAWQSTATHAALLKVAASPAAASGVSKAATSAAPSSATSIGAAAPGVSAATAWAVNVSGTPKLNSDVAVTPLETSKSLHIAVSLQLHNRDKLDAFLKDLHDPASASYRHYLTPAAFKAAYAPTDQDVQSVVAYLQKNGFSNVQVSPNNLLVSADGNTLNVSAAFNTGMKQFSANGQQFYGNDSDAQVPQALGGVVSGVLGLQNLNVKQTLSHRVTLAEDANGVNLAHAPSAVAQIYHVGTTPTAYATTVAVVGWADQAQTQADLNQFTTANLLAPVTLNVVKVPANGDFEPDADAEGEWALDTQTIVGVSGGVKNLMFYTAPTASDANLLAAESQAVTDNLAKLINCSFGEDEGGGIAGGTAAAEDAVLAQAEAQGQIFSVSTGDTGAYTWARGHAWNLASAADQANLTKYTTSWPASSAHVVAVGGTELFTDPNNSTVWSSEVVWNDGLHGDGTLWAGGGGISDGIPAPAWQTQYLGSLANTNRVLPDIAFNAYTGVAIVGGQPGAWEGTSLASPIFVGAFARIETAANNSIGLPTSDMYRDFSNPANAGLLHDITSGNNGLQGNGYKAAAGFDYATGWGSFDIDKLRVFAVANWGDGSAPPAPPVPPAPVVTVLQNGSTAQAAGTPNAISQFTIDVPAGAKALNLRTFGGTGDVALYVKFGAAASATSYDFASSHAGSNSESVTIATPKAGTYYLTVTSPVTYVNVNVGARYVQP